MAGDDYTTTFTAGPGAAATLSLPDFVRGPAQTVHVPAAHGGLPLMLNDADGVQTIEVTLSYDPALLTIAASDERPAGLPDLPLDDGKRLVLVGDGGFFLVDTATWSLARQPCGADSGGSDSAEPDSAEPDDEYAAMLLAVGALWLNGCDVDWATFHEGETRRWVKLRVVGRGANRDAIGARIEPRAW